MSRSCRSRVTLLLKISIAVFRELKEALDATLVVVRVLIYLNPSNHADTWCIEEADRTFPESLEDVVILVQRQIIRLQHVFESRHTDPEWLDKGQPVDTDCSPPE